MRLTGQPYGTMTSVEAISSLGMSKGSFIKSGLSEFLEYYQVGRSRLYRRGDVCNFKHYCFVRRGLAELGLATPSPPAPLLPPGETMEAKRVYFDAYVDQDAHGVYCPRCDGPAVQDELGGPIWCPKCGINKIGPEWARGI